MLKNLSPSARGFIAGLFVMAIVALGFVSIRDGGTGTGQAPDTQIDASSTASASPDIAASDNESPSEEESAHDESDDDATSDHALGSDESASSNRYSDLPTVSPTALPVEALDTLDLISTGGPYPFRQDDGVFQNREGLLPDQPRGYYREYTVITPGSDDRGARRIVAGNDGDLYYTFDHYDSFEEIVW